MEEKHYGKPDEDTRLLQAVHNFARQQGCKSLVVAHHPRKELGIRQCQHPGSLLIDFIVDGKAYAARQSYAGDIECPLKG